MARVRGRAPVGVARSVVERALGRLERGGDIPVIPLKSVQPAAETLRELTLGEKEMISGISSAYSGLSLAATRFDRAAAAAVDTVQADGDPGATLGAGGGVTDAMVGMAVAQFAFMASLRVAETSNEMVRDALRLGDYGKAA